MAAAEALSVQGESPATEPEPEPAAVPASNAATPRWPQLMPVAQLIAVVLAVFAIIWNQQQTTDSLRTELRADIIRVEAGLAELRVQVAENGERLARVEAELAELRAQVAENGERLARIEGFLGIGIPDPAAEEARGAAGGPRLAGLNGANWQL